jgi:F-type H+-transporting ATPase subunit b
MAARMLRVSLFALAVAAFIGIAPALRGGAIVPAAPAFAQQEGEEEAEAAVEEEEHGEHGHGPFYRQTTFWAAVINFTLLLFVLRRLARRPVTTYLRDRRLIMERTMNEAAAMRAKAEALHKEYTDRLAQLDKELQKLREDIARAAEDDKKQIVADTEETARRLRSETEGLIDQHAKALAASVRRDVVEAATSAAEQILRGSLSDGDQQRLADAFKQNLAADRTSDAPAAAEQAPVRPRAEGRP